MEEGYTLKEYFGGKKPISILEEFYADYAAAYTGEQNGFDVSPATADYFYSFSTEGIGASLTENFTHANYYKPWQEQLSFPELNRYYLNNDRTGFYLDLGNRVLNQNPHSSDLSEKFRRGVGLVYTASMMFGKAFNNENHSAQVLTTDKLTPDIITELAWFEHNNLHPA